MSPVDVAMVGGGFMQQLKRALSQAPVPGMARRDLLIDAADKVVDVKKAFSSWDNCVKASYCKWPAIAVIVIGSFLVISIVWCIVRRIFCGLACCCSCFQCLKCCGNCCGCCDAPNKRQQKYLDAPYIPPDHGYQAQPAMQAPSAAGAPRYAEFDMPRKGGDDALPEMPSWESGSSKKVMLEHDEVEMNHLDKPPPPPSSAHASVVSAPTSTALGPRAGYGRQSSAYLQGDQRGYFDHDPSSGPNGFGSEMPSPSGPYGPPSTHNSVRRQDAADGFGRMGRGPSYGVDARTRGDYQYATPSSATPAPREQDYGPSGYPQAGYDAGSYPPARRTSPPAAWPSQSQQPYPEPALHSPPIANNAGFDFTSGYARSSPPDRHPRDATNPSTPAYPGYKPYQPAQTG